MKSKSILQYFYKVFLLAFKKIIYDYEKKNSYKVFNQPFSLFSFASAQSLWICQIIVTCISRENKKISRVFTGNIMMIPIIDTLVVWVGLNNLTK